MFRSRLSTLQENILAIESALSIHDALRAIIYDHDTSDPDRASARSKLVKVLPDNPPSTIQWRVFGHCAALVRLYAVYERFIVHVVSEWLGMLPKLYRDYQQLPEGVRRGHRQGIAEILPRLGSDRYGHLSEETVVRGMYKGTTGQGAYDLPEDLFILDEQNLRKDTLERLFTRVGITNLWGTVCKNGEVQQFLTDVRGNENTAEAELRQFVDYRNDAAHGDVDEVLSTDEILKIAEFVKCLCKAVSGCVTRDFIRYHLNEGSAVIVGKIIRCFPERVVGVEMKETSVSVDERLYVFRDSGCYSVNVKALEIEHVRHSRIDAPAGLKVGVELDQPAKQRSVLVRVILGSKNDHDADSSIKNQQQADSE